MANSRISQLQPIIASQLSGNDLFVISDVSGPQSKKLSLADLDEYLLSGGQITGSFYGTASFALSSISASYATNASNSTFALTASYALNGGTGGGGTVSASFASASISSSYSLTASYALLNSVTSASYALNSRNSNSASFVIYTGGNNGTVFNAINASTSSIALTTQTASYTLTSNSSISASYALSSSYSTFSNNAGTASIANYAQTASVGIITVIQSSASWASQSLSASYSDLAAQSYTAITASYIVPNIQYGIFLPTTQSNFVSQIDLINLQSYSSNLATASIEAVGNVILPFTSSVILSEYVSLNMLNRSSGITTVLDTVPIFINTFGNGATWGSGSSGSMQIPYTLMGQGYFSNDSYMCYVTCSSTNINITPTRLNKFNINSNGYFGVSNAEGLFLTTNNPSDLITFSSSIGGPYRDTAQNILISGSSLITAMDLSSLTSNIRYVWTLGNLTSLTYNGATSTTDIGGVPNSLVTMSLQNGGLSYLYDLSNTSVRYLNLYGNNLSLLNNLPSTMSYINCSNNPVISLPNIPYGVTQLYCSNTSINTPPNVLASTVVTMSFASNTNLNLWLTTLPASLTYFDISFSSTLQALPTIPANVLYLNVSNCAFTAIAQDNICSNLVSNGLSNGNLNLINNASLLPTTLTRISTLQGRGWTVSY